MFISLWPHKQSVIKNQEVIFPINTECNIKSRTENVLCENRPIGSETERGHMHIDMEVS